MYSLGIIYMDLHNHDRVLDLFQRLASLDVEDGGSNAGPLFKVNLYLAKIYAIKWKYELAIPCFAQCLRLVMRRSE
jgi:hypothetical protein